jgi:hypothetical protein
MSGSKRGYGHISLARPGVQQAGRKRKTTPSARTARKERQE